MSKKFASVKDLPFSVRNVVKDLLGGNLKTISYIGSIQPEDVYIISDLARADYPSGFVPADFFGEQELLLFEETGFLSLSMIAREGSAPNGRKVRISIFQDGSSGIRAELFDIETGIQLNSLHTEENIKVARISAPQELSEDKKTRVLDIFSAVAEPKELGELLRSAREEQGLSQAEVGRRMGVSRATVNKIETGSGNPTWKTLTAYAEAVKPSI